MINANPNLTIKQLSNTWKDLVFWDSEFRWKCMEVGRCVEEMIDIGVKNSNCIDNVPFYKYNVFICIKVILFIAGIMRKRLK